MDLLNFYVGGKNPRTRKNPWKRGTSIEYKIMDIIAGEMSVLNRGDNFEEKYQQYFQKLKNDTAYKKTFCKYEKTIVIDVFIENEFHDELKEYENNRKIE